MSEHYQSRIGCCIRLQEANVHHHLYPLASHPLVEKIHVIRHLPLTSSALPNLTFHGAPGRSRLHRFEAMFRTCRRLVNQRDVDAFVSFNPIPYGMIALLAARGQYRCPVHLGFIGTDWYGGKQRIIRRLTTPLLQRADLITVTGEGMRQQAIAEGFNAPRVCVLPHTIDVDAFPENAPDRCRYDLITVGRLAYGKRIDMILRATKNLLPAHPGIRVCIAGDGPERQKLETLTQHLAIREHVDFVGHVEDVSNYLRQARVFVLSSDSEGVPFALIEAMASGLVPVCTDVGTIGDVIKDNENGILVPPGDVATFTRAVCSLLDDHDRYATMRDAVVNGRGQFAHAHAAAVWTPWLERVRDVTSRRGDAAAGTGDER